MTATAIATVDTPPSVIAWRAAVAAHARAPRRDRAAFRASLAALWAARLAVVDDSAAQSYLDTLAA